jgi:uncharacterized membrane protein YfcA
MGSLFEIAIIILAGFLGGFFTTVASSGSAVTLPLLLFLGLSPAVATGTNRLPIAISGAMACITFIRAGKVNPIMAAKVVVPTLIGGVIGSLFINPIPPVYLEWIIVGSVVIALILLLTSIKQTLLKTHEEPPRFRHRDYLYLFLIGLWVGLIFLDGATYLLMVLILSMRFHLAEANAYKNIVVFTVTTATLVVLAANNDIDWGVGLTLSVGGIAGGYIGAKFSMHQLAKKWTYRMLLAIMIFELAHIIFLYSTGTLISGSNMMKLMHAAPMR